MYMKVFPTHVGVFLISKGKVSAEERLPHARGGVSLLDNLSERRLVSSPRTWGCFYVGRHPDQRGAVFPTHVGVFLPI